MLLLGYKGLILEKKLYVLYLMHLYKIHTLLIFIVNHILKAVRWKMKIHWRWNFWTKSPHWH